MFTDEVLKEKVTSSLKSTEEVTILLYLVVIKWP